MAKNNLKDGNVWKHKPTGNLYKIIKKSKIKIPHAVVGNSWFDSVTYKDSQGNIYNRFLDDFLNKFEFHSKKQNKDEKSKSNIQRD